MSDLIDRLKSSRKNPAVLLLKYMNVRNKKPRDYVLVFEGVEDVGVYEEWIRRARPGFRYEPLPGQGKEQVLGFRAMLRDHNPSLYAFVYFFVDCDFDEWHASGDRLYTLPAYSAENIYCSSEVLASLLNDEFRCAGDLDIRLHVGTCYETARLDFENLSHDMNFLMYSARQLGIKWVTKPRTVAPHIVVKTDSVALRSAPLESLVAFERHASDEEARHLRERFILLDTLRAQRGKYLEQFFNRWLEVLSDDRRSATPVHFSSSVNIGGAIQSVTARRLAANSPLPEGLQDFVQAIAA